MSENNNNTKVPFTTDITGGLLSLLTQYHDKYDTMHSLQYTLEQALITGLKALTRSKEYAETTKKNNAFINMLAKDPTLALNPERFNAMMKKFGIGASKGGKQTFEEAELELIASTGYSLVRRPASEDDAA